MPHPNGRIPAHIRGLMSLVAAGLITVQTAAAPALSAPVRGCVTVSFVLRRSFALPSVLFVAALVAGGAIAHAAVSPGRIDMPALIRAVEPARVLLSMGRGDSWTGKTLEQKWTFEGRDLDGDGAADFVNPTGKVARDHDGFGDGDYGASRDGGVRRHEGVDYSARAGQTAVAPISGYVTKIGYAYADDREFRFVEITNPALGVEARVFYLNPGVVEGQAVRLGAPIGRVESLQGRYPGITDHVHLEIAEAGRRINPETVIVARLETQANG